MVSNDLTAGVSLPIYNFHEASMGLMQSVLSANNRQPLTTEKLRQLQLSWNIGQQILSAAQGTQTAIAAIKNIDYLLSVNQGTSSSSSAAHTPSPMHSDIRSSSSADANPDDEASSSSSSTAASNSLSSSAKPAGPEDETGSSAFPSSSSAVSSSSSSSS